ncbi:MAG: type I glyceraldehyde-3-phosphate dehydrogenase [Peptococcaceae bacterium]|nr:type I glyceraldehyde-3-phosphate dehydrogenase [Peptococcaceae bacterium]
MAIKVGINGFGRIGRNFLRVVYDHHDIEVVAINDLTNAATLAHLLKYDSVHGVFPPDVRAQENSFWVEDQEIKVFSEADPSRLPWGELGVEYVIESTGRFRKADDARKHLDAGAKKVVISAPATGEDIMIIMGVNEHRYKPGEHHIISAGSCTTNCLAPIVKVLHEKYKVKRGFMTTAHSYTNDQRLLDLPHRDLRRARAAGMSIIPTTTGAAKNVSQAIPDLEGKLTGLAFRVPTPDVSIVDFVAELNTSTVKEELNDTLRAAAEGELEGILAYSELPLVSRDYTGDPHSAIVDGLSTFVIDGNFVKVVAWYDNEWGFCNRLLDIVLYMHFSETLGEQARDKVREYARVRK